MEFELTGTPAALVIFIILFIVGVIALIPFLIMTAIAGRASRFAHRKKHLMQNVIVAEYAPPADLSPAEIGYLFDSRLTRLELKATLVDLEQRGLVKIVGSKGDDIAAERTAKPAPDNLKPHENYVLDSLSVKASFSLGMVNGFKSFVVQSLQEQGFVRPLKDIFIYYAKRTAAAYAFLVASFSLALLLMTDGSIVNILTAILGINMIAFPVLLIAALIIGWIYGRVVGQPGLWTPKLKAMWRELEGYRNYIEQVELNQIKFESKDLKIRSKNKALPYAIALNLDTK